MAKINTGSRSIPKGSQGKTMVKASPPSSQGKGSSQWGGRKPSGGRI